MKRPWQIWTLYALCLATVVPAMAWLTVKACQLDRAEAVARRQADAARVQADEARVREEAARQRAELEEDVSLALWRLDTWLAPLISQEAARPHFVYRSFYTLPAKPPIAKGAPSEALEQPSPLLMQPSEYVLLNFQVTPENTITSPQAPAENLNPLAIANGATLANIEISNDRMAQLKPQVDHQSLWSQLPEQTLPRVELDGFAWNSTGSLPQEVPGQGAMQNNVNDLGLNQLGGQFEQQSSVAQSQQAEQPTQTPPLMAGNSPDRSAQASQGPDDQGTQQRYQVSRDPQTQMARGGNEFQRRNRAFQNYAQQVLSGQRQGIPKVFAKTLVSEGVSRPLWLGPYLVLARRVALGDQVLVQGAWLDWDKIKADLLSEVADLLPDADLVPVTGAAEANPARMLAALPVRLVVPQPMAPAAVPVAAGAAASPVSPIRVSLWIAWACLALAAVAVAVLLKGVVALSERRAAFVAAVTHELRTPLTTFRMYAEMLSEGMISDQAKRKSYLDTLRSEAERLTHLVSNVLSYARLERGRPGVRREKIALSDLADRVHTRLADRAGQVEMDFAIEVAAEVKGRFVRTDPAAVEQILFNLVDNACKYASEAQDRRVHLSISADREMARLTVHDHGPGISRTAQRRLFIPFSKSVHDAANTAPGVGLGLALCRRLARDLGGTLDFEPGDDAGAAFVLSLPLA